MELKRKITMAKNILASAAILEIVRHHEVKSGDTLSSIAKRYYGKITEWPRIYKANKYQIKNPNRIFPGQILHLPGKGIKWD
jgi:nucleoid-associated protein YgaU